MLLSLWPSNVICHGDINTLFFYPFQTLCLAFFNSLIGISPTFNKKVFHQQEIEDAGFDVERLERVIHVYFIHVAM